MFGVDEWDFDDEWEWDVEEEYEDRLYDLAE